MHLTLMERNGNIQETKLVSWSWT